MGQVYLDYFNGVSTFTTLAFGLKRHEISGYACCVLEHDVDVDKYANAWGHMVYVMDTIILTLLESWSSNH